MNTIITLCMGLVGALLMFAGDMTLYFSKKDFTSENLRDSIINIMKTESKPRLYIGSLLGPIAAFFYCIGYYHIVLIMEKYHALGLICFLVNCLGIILGVAYHSHWVYLGRVGRLENDEATSEISSFMKFLNKVSYAIIGVGFLMLIVLIALDFTILPRWMVVFTPGVLFLLIPLIRKVPKCVLHMVVCGGWSNLISVIYYVATIIVVCLLFVPMSI